MKKLDSKVNLIPVVAKSDVITKAEMQKFKARVSYLFRSVLFPYFRIAMLFQQILNEIQQEDIKIYQFPTDDDTVAEVNARMNVSWMLSNKSEHCVVSGDSSFANFADGFSDVVRNANVGIACPK